MKTPLLIPYTPAYETDCIKLALDVEAKAQVFYKERLGDKIWTAAFGNWEQTTTDRVKGDLAQLPAFVALQDGKVVGFAAYRTAKNIGVFASKAVNASPECAGALYEALLADMRQKGLTHCMADCFNEPYNEAERAGFQAAGFEKYLPHVRYYQVLPEKTELPETQLQIVRCEKEHIADCSRIAVQVWEGIHDAYIGMIGEDIHEAVSGGWREAKAAEVAQQQERSTAFVALLEGKVVGFVGYRMANENLGVVGYNGVDPEYRGKGIARYLYQRVLDEIRSQGAPYATVFTGGDDGHAPARRAYEKAGFNERLFTLTYYCAL